MEKLSIVINDYFRKILDEVERFQGDVLKFAGDALFVIWPIDEDDVLRTKKLSFVTALAVKCAARIVATCSDYKV